MLELLSPAGCPEAVVAAVQNGADAIYLGFGTFNSHQGARNFTDEAFFEAVKYCRVRGCRSYLALDVLVDDKQAEQAVQLATRAAELGVDAILVQDMGLLRILRLALPDMPIHAGPRMDIHSLAGVEAVAELGAQRAFLAPELTLAQITAIAHRASIEVGVSVHGPICFAHGGSCRLSAFRSGVSDARGLCAQPCRTPCSLGGRMDVSPLSLKDLCLAGHVDELREAGVACLRIEGPAYRPEYAAAVTALYSGLIRMQIHPTAAQMEDLEDAFHRGGVTNGYLTGEKGSDMFAPVQDAGREANRYCAEVRRSYVNTESRRIRTELYAVVHRNEPVRLAAIDPQGNRAAVQGAFPTPADGSGVTDSWLTDILGRTGGTPFRSGTIHTSVEPGLHVEVQAMEELLHAALNDLARQRALAPAYRGGVFPAPPVTALVHREATFCYSLRQANQLSPELLELAPERLYLPLTELASHFDEIRPFMEAGVVPVAVLPRVLTDREQVKLRPLLTRVRTLGVTQAQISGWDHVYLARRCGFSVRGGEGLVLRNSWAMALAQKAGFLSVTAPPDLPLAQIAALAKPVDTELLVYGRPTLAVTDHCLIRNSSGRCGCQTPGQLNDRRGALLPVLPEYGCRNQILSETKLFLADRLDDCRRTGAAALCLKFTTENARECAAIAARFTGTGGYVPSGAGRGLYYREEV